MSPGGRIRKSRRSRPELPPSSVTVTMALSDVIAGLREGAPEGSAMLCFSPRRTVDNPVPPPIATTLIWRELLSWTQQAIGLRSGAGPRCHALFRTDQIGEARVRSQRLEVFILASLKPVLGPQINGSLQVFQRGIGIAVERMGSRQRVMRLLTVRLRFYRLRQVFDGSFEAPGIQLGHTGHIVIFSSLQTAGRGLKLSLAHTQVNARPIGNFRWSAGNELFQDLLGLIVVLLLDVTDSGLVILNGRRILRLNVSPLSHCIRWHCLYPSIVTPFEEDRILLALPPGNQSSRCRTPGSQDQAV